MPLPELVYASLGGPINQDTIQRILTNLAGATQGGAREVHLMIQSTGGNVDDAIALYNFLRTFPVDLHVYNSGMVASVAVVAFLGARNRYASTHATFMIHKVYATPQGPQTAAKLRAMANSVDIDDLRVETILKAEAAIPPDRWRQHDSREVYFSAQDSVKFGLTHGIREFQVPGGEPILNV